VEQVEHVLPQSNWKLDKGSGFHLKILGSVEQPELFSCVDCNPVLTRWEPEKSSACLVIDNVSGGISFWGPQLLYPSSDY
jgi:hypothetical protein